MSALRPGTTLIVRGYTPKQIKYGTGGPSNSANPYVEADLWHGFGNGRIEHLAKHESLISEGAHHHGMSALIDLVAVKPGWTNWVMRRVVGQNRRWP